MSRWVWRAGGIGLVAGLVIMLVLLMARADHQLRDLGEAKHRMCVSQRLDIESLIKNSVGIGDIRTRIRFDVADQSTSLLCLGTDIPPVDFEAADACWIGHGDVKRCYDEPLRALLALYRQRGF